MNSQNPPTDEQQDIQEQVVRHPLDEKPKRQYLPGFNKTKLTNEQQTEIIKMQAEFKKNTEIIEYAKEAWGITLSVTNIVQYKNSKKWEPLRKRFRDEYLANISEVAGTHKRVRLERLENIYHKSMTAGKVDAAMRAIENQRVEIEGKDSRNQDVNLTLNQFYMLNDEELEQKRIELMEKVRNLSIPKKDILQINHNEIKEATNGNGGIQE